MNIPSECHVGISVQLGNIYITPLNSVMKPSTSCSASHCSIRIDSSGYLRPASKLRKQITTPQPQWKPVLKGWIWLRIALLFTASPSGNQTKSRCKSIKIVDVLPQISVGWLEGRVFHLFEAKSTSTSLHVAFQGLQKRIRNLHAYFIPAPPVVLVGRAAGISWVNLPSGSRS